VKKDATYYQATFRVSKTTLKVGDSAKATVYWNGSVLKNSGAVIESSNPSVCKVSNGTIKALKAGKAVIRFYFPGYKEKMVEKTITVKKSTSNNSKTLTVTYKANGGSASKKSKTVTVGKKYGTLATASRKGYTFKGWYTAKSGGTKVTSSTKVTGSKNITLYARWTKISVARASVQSLTNKKGAKVTVKINKVSSASGYEIVSAANSKFTKDKNTVTVKGTSKTLTGLTKGRTCYVKVRAYKLDSAGSKVYGKYSTVQKVKISK
jgi:uncharacterized repeat protein (TIGR02543 family)